MTGAPLAELAQLTQDGWLVGGALRDQLLGRESTDYDVAVPGDAHELARELSRRTGGHPFALSDAFGAWRVIARDRSWQIDLTPLMGATLEEDLARRDLTVNALARSLQSDELIDLHGGVADLRARQLRMVGPDAFASDPLRTIRLARIGAELDFTVEAETEVAAMASVAGLSGVSAERVFSELRQIIVCDRATAGLRWLDRLGAAAQVLPELVALRGIEQSDYHHLDVLDHTFDVLERVIELDRDPRAVLGPAAEGVSELMAEPLANELTRGQALRFGALFHDIAKSVTRSVTSEGRVTFMGHDAAGAQIAIDVLGRLRASDRLSAHVAALTRHHLRLGFLVHETPLQRRAVYRYLSVCDPVEVDVTLLSVADRLATRGRNSERAIDRHLELSRMMLPEALRWHSAPPRPPVRGDRLAAALQIPPGPEIGRLLAELTEAAFAGEVDGEAEAIAWARSSSGARDSEV